MRGSNLQFATGARWLACLALLTLAPSVRAERPTTATPAPAVRATPALDHALWRLASGGAAVAPVDAATFVGPPVPLAILYAPPLPALQAGMRIELEAPRASLGPPAPAPPAEPQLRGAEVFDRRLPVLHPGGWWSLDLTGITLVDAHAWRDAAGLHLGEDDAWPAGGGER